MVWCSRGDVFKWHLVFLKVGSNYLWFPVCSPVEFDSCVWTLDVGHLHARLVPLQRRGPTLWLVQELLDNRCPVGWEVDYLWRRERVESERERKKSGGVKWRRGRVTLLWQIFTVYREVQYSGKHSQPDMTTFVCTFLKAVFSVVFELLYRETIFSKYYFIVLLQA